MLSIVYRLLGVNILMYFITLILIWYLVIRLLLIFAIGLVLLSTTQLPTHLSLTSHHHQPLLPSEDDQEFLDEPHAPDRAAEDRDGGMVIGARRQSQQRGEKTGDGQGLHHRGANRQVTDHG